MGLLLQRGNDIAIAFAAVAILIWIFQGWQYRTANRKRAAKFVSLSDPQKQAVQERVEADGSRGLLFKSVVPLIPRDEPEVETLLLAAGSRRKPRHYRWPWRSVYSGSQVTWARRYSGMGQSKMA